jgi:hypothetical protein
MRGRVRNDRGRSSDHQPSKWCLIFAMKRSDSAAQFRVLWQGPLLRKTRLTLEKIEVIEDQKHGQNDIDNHTSQNYNVEHFFEFLVHGFPAVTRPTTNLNNTRIRVSRKRRGKSHAFLFPTRRRRQ